MIKEITVFISSPLGIALCVLALVLSIPLIKLVIWKLFSFDARVNKMLEQKKSSEVRMGKVTETLAPMLKQFPVDVRKVGTSTVFIGQPVDYIHFDPQEGITFIEVKSANSKLSATQRQLEELINEGKVRWLNMNVKGRE